MTTIKSSMSTKVQFTCKSFLSGDSCLPIIFEFYDGALYIFHSILNIKIKKTKLFTMRLSRADLRQLAVTSIKVLSSLPSVSDIHCDV